MDHASVKKRSAAGLLTAVAVVGSLFSFPVLGSQCAPVQHMVNIVCAVCLGPWYGVGVAFAASLIRNLLGLGTPMAFPGSMLGALLCGLVYAKLPRLPAGIAVQRYLSGYAILPDHESAWLRTDQPFPCEREQ